MKTKYFLIFLLILFSSKLIIPQNWNAVCVGINDYPGSSNDLNWCINDANSMKYYLETYKQWSSNKINLLTDAYADESSIHTAVANMSRSTGNTNCFHFSGHGSSAELGGNDGLIPSNSLSARITQSELQTDFGSSYNQCATFLDACGSGIFSRDMSIGAISSACLPNESSWESSSIEHGFYTYFLLAGLAQSSINTAEELHNYAAPLVTEAVNEIGYSQHPQLGDNFGGYLNLYNASYTLSGTLSRSETWSAGSTLQGNVYIPSGITLTLAGNLNMNLNGYSIISNGGSIYMQQGAQINGLIAYSKLNNIYKGLFPSIELALSYASSGQIITMTGSQYISNDLSIVSNITLSINSGVVLTINADKKLSVYGTLNSNGATFQGNGTPGYWHSISFNANSSGTIQNSIIRDAQCGIHIPTNANVSVIYSTIQNNSIYGINSLTTSVINISGCTIQNNPTGVRVYSSASTISGNYILNNFNYGILADNIGASYSWHDNTLQGNGNYGAAMLLSLIHI